VTFRILLLVALGAAGVGASYALGDSGPHHGRLQSTTTGSCQRAHVLGTVSAPQAFTVTITKAGRQSPVAPSQVVTVTIGDATGQSVRVNAVGCLSGSTLTAKQAVVHAFSTVPRTTGTTSATTTGGRGHGDGDHHGTKPPTGTGTTSTTTTSTTTTP
jgi:hypothetical protein